ncbi:OsmC family protein [Shewanella eurypsychrophilus]|uniref:OsmC family protein n=1 Tax=Shewanella eurypsychrophilus TaxID=2593656 RepID=A0ABX6V4W9_9GAMM|nr:MULTISPECIES: OsmC family protein [Shewanella]QFU22405.1 OsmC family peroxiredoxin [Shewanella sp. YLB-09]QPG57692.1 OsmC family protein [Shewanella eurypsychrophilus]
MSEYFAKVTWSRQESENFVDNQYSRGHEWIFDGGVVVPASSSAHIVPLPFSVATNVDPEEAFVASLSSCHMLFFLSIAAKRKFVIDDYTDNAVGVMSKGETGKMAMTQVILRPKVRFCGDKQPSLAMLEKMHHQSHDQCFIANSVKTEVITEIVLT